MFQNRKTFFLGKIQVKIYISTLQVTKVLNDFSDYFSHDTLRYDMIRMFVPSQYCRSLQNYSQNYTQNYTHQFSKLRREWQAYCNL